LFLIIASIILFGFSYLEPPVLTPTEWLEQLNPPEDMGPPGNDRYQQFEPGDVVYIEGEVDHLTYLNTTDVTLIAITDGHETAVFAANGNISDLPHPGDHVFLKIEIRKQGSLNDPFILSGIDPLYFDEEAVYVGYDKEHYSLKPILLVIGLVMLIIGILITLYSAFSRRIIDKKGLEEKRD